MEWERVKIRAFRKRGKERRKREKDSALQSAEHPE